MIHLGSAQNIRPRCTERKDPQRRHLCEGKACFVVHFEDFFNGVDIGCCSEVQPEVILVGCAHDLLKGEKKSSVNKQSNPKTSLYKHFIHQTNVHGI